MNTVFELMGTLLTPTISVTLTDASQDLQTLVDLTDAEFHNVVAALVTVEGYDCRISFGVDPTTTTGHIVSVGASFRIASHNLLENLRFINKTAGEDSLLTITLEGRMPR